MYLFNSFVHSAIIDFVSFRKIMSNRSSQDELSTGSTTNTQTFLENSVLDDDHKALEEYLLNNPVHQSDLDRCLLRGLQIVQRKEKQLSHVASALTILLQYGAKWNNDVLLDEQKTPYHIICESPGDHHELLVLMIKSCQRTIIDAQDVDKCTALVEAVRHANINCLKSLITHGADLNIGNDRYPLSVGKKPPQQWTAIMVAIHNIVVNMSAINVDIFDLLIYSGADVNKPTLNTDYLFMSPLIYAVVYRNVYCIQKLIEKEARPDIMCFRGNVWATIAELGNVELLKCLFNHGIDKDSRDVHGSSVLKLVVASGNVEAVQYLLDLGVSVPSYKPEPHKKNKYMVDIKQEEDDPCILAICCNRLDMVKLLEKYGCESCEFFTALRSAVIYGGVDVASYLLHKYKYPLNVEYMKELDQSEPIYYTLLIEPRYRFSSQMIKLLLDHGADPAKPMCSARSVNAIMTAIAYGNLYVIAQYIRSGVDINLKSYDSSYGKVLPFEASVLRGYHDVAEILLIYGCSCGVFNLDNNHKFKNNLKPEVEKLMKEWKVQENNVAPLKQRCRSVILNHLSPRADKKIQNLPLPRWIIMFLNVSEIDDMINMYKEIDKH